MKICRKRWSSRDVTQRIQKRVGTNDISTPIAIIWAGFKMIFQGARLADVANVLIGGTLVGGAAAFASYIVS